MHDFPPDWGMLRRLGAFWFSLKNSNNCGSCVFSLATAGYVRFKRISCPLPIIPKQCNGYQEATVLITRRTVGNVVQSVLFAGVNRDGHVQSHPFALRVANAFMLDQTFSSPLVLLLLLYTVLLYGVRGCVYRRSNKSKKYFLKCNKYDTHVWDD